MVGKSDARFRATRQQFVSVQDKKIFITFATNLIPNKSLMCYKKTEILKNYNVK